MTGEASNPLPSGWVQTALREVVQPRAERRRPSEMPDARFIGLEHIEAHTMRLLGTVRASEVKSSAAHFGPGDVLYGRLRPYLNKVYRPAFEGLASAEFIVFPNQAAVSGGYLQYFLNSWAFCDHASHQVAGDRPRVDFSQLGEFLFPFPPLPEQHRIVAEIEKQLTRLDAATAALERARGKLKRYRASILKAACEGRLVPTEAELAWREGRKYEHARILIDHIEAERCRIEKGKSRAVIRDSNPAETPWPSSLPDGWTWSTLGQLMGSLRNGYSKRPGATEGMAILRISAVRPMSVDAHDIRYVQDDPATLRGFLVGPGDLLFTRYNGNPQFVGVCGVVGQLDRPTIHPDKLIRVCLILGEPLPEWVEIAANNGESRAHIASRVRTTAGQAGISGGDLRTMPIPLPPTNEQLRIVAEVGRLLSKVQATEQTIEASLKRADRLRQAVLKHAFGGKLVPQDPADEPASVLLDRIRAMRAPVGGDSVPRKPARPRPAGRRGKSVSREARK